MDCANCKWTLKTHNGSLSSVTCGEFSPKAVAARNSGPTLTVIPDRCAKCGEALTPKVTKGAYLCRCDMPKAPRSVLADAANTPLPGLVRYGGR